MGQNWQLKHTFSISAGHMLLNLGKDHPCTEEHGHNWKITVCICSDTIDKKTGFVVDFHRLKHDCKGQIHSRLDHKKLNNVLDFSPTVENLARWMYQQMQDVYGELMDHVEVEETDGNSCTYWED